MRIDQKAIKTLVGLSSLRIRSHSLPSFLAILGGGLFLILPVAFLNGAVSINYVFTSEPQCMNPICPVAIVPMPNEMALNLIFLGVIGVLVGVIGFLGFLTLRLDPRPKTGVALGFGAGFAFSLGLMVFMFERAISRILDSFSVGPFFALNFPDLSIVIMAGAGVVFVYEFLRAIFSLPLTFQKQPSSNEIRPE